ncbi:hypothetical protein quinque_002383 [Culex quinquefasciatus]
MMETDTDLLMPAPEESPYFPEKYPGKVCALCALGERSQLGQGEMDGSRSRTSQSGGQTGSGGGVLRLGLSLLLSSNKRQKGLNVTNPIINAEYVIELEKIGHTEPVEFASIKNGGYFYTHRSCASWSFGVGLGAATGTLSNLEVVVAQALSKKFGKQYKLTPESQIKYNEATNIHGSDQRVYRQLPPNLPTDSEGVQLLAEKSDCTIATLVTIFTFDNQLCQIVRERGPIHDNHIYQIYRGRNFAGQVSDGRPEAFQHQVMSSILFLPGYQTIFCPTTHVIVFGMSMKPPDAGSPQQHVKVPVSVSMAEPSSG